MSNPPPRKKRPADINQLAYSIIRDATAEPQAETVEPTEQPPGPPKSEKDPAAVSLGRRGGLKGGPARANKLTAEERSEVGKKAAKARWAKD